MLSIKAYTFGSTTQTLLAARLKAVLATL